MYDKLKHRLYNSFYRRQKRLESRFSGDLLKIRDELGVDIPKRPKRPRKSKENSEPTTSGESTVCASGSTTNVASASTGHALEANSLPTDQGD